MKILMVSEDIPHPHLGGLGRHVLNLAHELHRRGHDVDLLGNADRPISAHPDQAGPGRFFGEISGHARGWKERHIGAFNPIKVPLNGRKVSAAIMRHAASYDVVHYHGHLPWVGRYIPPHVPFTQTRHDQGGDCMLKTRFRPAGGRCFETDPAACAGCASQAPNFIQTQLSRISVERMRRSTARAFEQHPVIFVSEFLRSAFARVAGNYAGGDVIHNAVDSVEIERALLGAPAAPTERFRVEFFSAGAMFGYKGYDDLLGAVQGNPLPDGVRLTLAGDGPLLEPLRQRFESSKIRFLGWRAYPDVLAHVVDADAVLVPSACDESCPTTVLEALALGKTVFALERGGIPELARYARSPSGELRLFVSSIEMVRAMHAFRVDRGRAVSAVLPGFTGTIESMTNRVLQHYEQHFNAPIIR